ncbi:MAG TPA: hypothetical protein DEP84_36710 [Chloroflexi bacterium]|nr:hypothetical protein [Chloroflexota bacterium]
MTTEQNYQSMIAAYTSQLRGLFTPPEEAAPAGAATRGAEAPPTEVLAERAETLATTSQRLGGMTAGYLDAEDRALREAAEMKLLAQAIAEFEVGRGLLEIAEEEAEGPAPGGATRALRTATIQQSINELIDVLETPLEAGVQPFLTRTTRAVEARPKEPERAKTDLKTEVETSLRDICRQANKVGGRAARDLLLMDAAVLYEGVTLISRDAADLLDKAITGLSELVQRLALSGLRLLLQAYDRVLALLGKDVEAKARKQVAEWLEELKQEPEEGSGTPALFEQLVNRIYTPDTIGKDVDGWLKTTQADVNDINQAAETVEGLPEKYRVKTEQVERLLKIVAVAKQVPMMKTPVAQVIVAAVTSGLLGYTLYAGYDHVDSGRVVFAGRFGFNIPDRVEGVRETAQKALGVAEGV